MDQLLNLLAPVWSHLTQIQPVRGEGIYLYDAAGNRYMDFTSGIGVTNTGHCHPAVVRAVQKQAENLLFGQINIVVTPAALELVDALNQVTPEGIDRFFLTNSGAEAVEASVKLARHATGRQNIIVFQGSFHGRTAQTMAMTTSKYIYRHQYQPLPAGVYVAPFPYSHHYGWNEQQSIEFCLQELDLLFHSQTSPEETAAVIIEPVLGEGGYVPAPSVFLRKLREICSDTGIVFIADEVQTGFGRTGRFFACEHAGVVPDILVMAKGMGSGLPISGIGAREELMSKWKIGSHGGTYGGGSAISMAAAVATIRALQEENLVENAAARGEQLLKELKNQQLRIPEIADVRGLGLMVAVEFTDSIKAKSVQKACLEKHLLLLTCGTYENVIRWIPPLVVTGEQVNTAISIFNHSLAV